jgi:hypothetical protein
MKGRRNNVRLDNSLRGPSEYVKSGLSAAFYLSKSSIPVNPQYTTLLTYIISANSFSN